jgi:hypothetical protein
MTWFAPPASMMVEFAPLDQLSAVDVTATGAGCQLATGSVSEESSSMRVVDE